MSIRTYKRCGIANKRDAKFYYDWIKYFEISGHVVRMVWWERIILDLCFCPFVLLDLYFISFRLVLLFLWCLFYYKWFGLFYWLEYYYIEWWVNYYNFLFDWISLLFMGFVFIISPLVILYSDDYIFGDLNIIRFISLVLIFVVSVWSEGKKRLEILNCRRENNIKPDFWKHKVG